MSAACTVCWHCSAIRLSLTVPYCSLALSDAAAVKLA